MQNKLTFKQEKAFKDISNLKKNWNSYGSFPFNPVVINKAKEICKFLGSSCEIEPQADGSIDLYSNGILYTVAIDDYSLIQTKTNLDFAYPTG